MPSWHGRDVPGTSDRPSVSGRLSIAVAGAGYTAIGDHLRQVLPEAEIELVRRIRCASASSSASRPCWYQS